MIKKHICFVSPKAYHYFKPDRSSAAGGAERQQYLLARELQKKGYTISFITGDFDGSTKEIIDGIELYKTLPVQHSPHAWDYIKNLVLSLHNVSADVCYVRGMRMIPAIVSLYCNFDNISFILSIANDKDVEHKHIKNLNIFLKYLYKRSILMADTVVAQTDYQRKMLKKQFDIESEVIPNGYTIPSSNRIVDHSKRNHILWVGQINKKQKKPHHFLQLAEEFGNESFVLIGPKGSREDYYRFIKNKAKSLSNVDFEGFVPPDKIHNYFRFAQVYVNTSEFEGFPNTFLEAWRYATPVVSLNHSVDHGFSNNNRAGIVSQSQGKLFKDVRNLLNNTDLRRRYGENGRKLVNDRYSIKRISNRYNSIIQ